LAVLGGLCQNEHLVKLALRGMKLDEPCCLLMSNAIKSCVSLDVIDMPGSKLGPKGGGIFITQILQNLDRFVKVDLRDNELGTFSMLPLSACLRNPSCNIHTLYLNTNLLEEEGAMMIVNAIEQNKVLTDLDLSNNMLTEKVALQIARVVRGRFEDGRKVEDSVMKRLILNENPMIGRTGCAAIFEGLIFGKTEHIEMVNCGAGPSVGRLISKALRTATLSWRVLDISNNQLSRSGLNHMMWSLRHNRSLRILRVANNHAGTVWGTDDDALGIHGIAIYRAIVENLALRELDLSGNNISTEGGNNILEALLQNQTLRIFKMANNFLDDDCSINLGDLVTYNSVIEHLDLSHNKLGFHCCMSLAQGLQINRAIHTLNVGYNRLGNAGPATLEHFFIALCVNTTMRVLLLDGNRLGPVWIRRLAEGFARNSTLIKVGIVLTRMDPKSSESMLTVYKKNQYMKELGVSIDEVGEPMYREFQAVYSKKRALPQDHVPQDTYETDVTLDPSVLVTSYTSMVSTPGKGGDNVVEKPF
jgi:Ran GTPase-activating protein (RanGAP) involved in mRNA processing and transport